ncbi:hypothetical protein J6590_072426 [Homalodisca vitripennis]|nr:hypothetical protein J6590_072426 [Homalodisca vitripennis]
MTSLDFRATFEQNTAAWAEQEPFPGCSKLLKPRDIEINSVIQQSTPPDHTQHSQRYHRPPPLLHHPQKVLDHLRGSVTALSISVIVWKLIPQTACLNSERPVKN